MTWTLVLPCLRDLEAHCYRSVQFTRTSQNPTSRAIRVTQTRVSESLKPSQTRTFLRLLQGLPGSAPANHRRMPVTSATREASRLASLRHGDSQRSPEAIIHSTQGLVMGHAYFDDVGDTRPKRRMCENMCATCKMRLGIVQCCSNAVPGSLSECALESVDLKDSQTQAATLSTCGPLSQRS